MTSPLAEIIRSEIVAAGGAISFARYMELALYHPEFGYYEQSPANVGRSGDFYTSVSVGPLFGELLAFHFVHRLLDRCERPFEIVEAGAHDGRLASDILSAIRRFAPEKAASVRYVLVEPSARRQSWQRETLKEFGDQVAWLSQLPETINGVVLSNELLDAFPLERWRWNSADRRWIEQGVGSSPDGFEWKSLPTGQPADLDIPEELARVLPDGFTRERCPSALNWWASAARSLRTGWLLAFDYALAAEEFLQPSRAGGTLRGYRNHRFADDLLGSPGEIDLTAHVNFSAVRETGEAAGLSTFYDGAQASFLMNIFGDTLNAADRFGVWTPARTRAFQTLTHPQHLGRSFRVLMQGRGV
jgi:SAM-dependent MidA family methyltransferase